ncbi:hypothetical protein C8J56DRAFT_107125 [Mycena floridula]|nr:hypothetical protein C8J56DRAFT_107125 [Mycena floridula]
MVNFVSAFTLTLVSMNVALTIAAPLQPVELVARDEGLLFAREFDDYPIMTRDLEARGGWLGLVKGATGIFKGLGKHKKHHKKATPSPSQDQQQQQQQRREVSESQLEARHGHDLEARFGWLSVAKGAFGALKHAPHHHHHDKNKRDLGLEETETLTKRSKAGKFFKGLFKKVKGIVGLRRDVEIKSRDAEPMMERRSKVGKFFKGLFKKAKSMVGLRRDEQLETRDFNEDLETREFNEELEARDFEEFEELLA